MHSSAEIRDEMRGELSKARERIAELEAALAQAQGRLHNAASTARELSRGLEASALEAYRFRDK